MHFVISLLDLYLGYILNSSCTLTLWYYYVNLRKGSEYFFHPWRDFDFLHFEKCSLMVHLVRMLISLEVCSAAAASIRLVSHLRHVCFSLLRLPRSHNGSKEPSSILVRGLWSRLNVKIYPLCAH